MESGALTGREGRGRKWDLGIIQREYHKESGDHKERMNEETECRGVSEGSGYVWMTEEAENVCEVVSEKMNGKI